MKILTRAVFLLMLLTSGPVSSEIIPPDRICDWTPGVNVGVPGGIPNRTVIGSTVDAAVYGTGSVDASAALGAAIDACPSGRVVIIPAGTYRLDSRVYRASAGNITIRGAGMGKTILKATSNAQVLLLGTADWPRATAGLAISAGATKGSTVLTVADATSITVGKLVRIQQNDLPYVLFGSAPTTNNRLMSAMFRVTAKTAASVTVMPPLPIDFTQSPELVQYGIPPLTNTGVEDLTIDCNSISWAGIEFDQAWGCWIKNVEIKNSTRRQMLLICFVNGEIRHNYTHDVVGGGPNHEGIDLYQDGSFNLIEDNIAYNGGFPGIILGDSKGGCSGNVIAYNLAYDANTGASTAAGMDISVSHGPHNMMNLVEGNITECMGSDGYFGSTSHITLARNWFTATHPTATENLIAVNLGRWNNYFNLVGNVLGTSSFSAAGRFQPETPFSYTTQVIYKLGFPNLGNNGFSKTWGPTTPPDYSAQAANQPGGDSHGTGGNTLQELDLNVKNTMLRHGNYDYLSHSIAWDAAISDHAIPNSYFRSSKPEWFGNLPWPPFDPANPPGAFNDSNVCRIPAGYRYVHGKDPVEAAEKPGTEAERRINSIEGTH
ncbi:MAG: glycosyl hydrolase family 28-related protein [Verrucomicrobiota bacterium]